ncbi:MAG TPA: RNA 2',3'-cyclic phosphodiesterase [Bryobacteraceae bacterium]|nr:RNA 2',3'-cyclic phosphodiesterase [Bryobacteraceae bacterium]
MRLFVAIDIPDHVKHKLRALVDRVKPFAKISWSPVDNLHVTTKFIGEWPEDRLDEMKHALASVGSPGAIPIAVRGIGWFPNPKNPRVFWVGVEGGEALNTLAHETEEAVYSIGVPKEPRKFAPHLTLARIRERLPLDPLRQALEQVGPYDFGSFLASTFYLYLSKGGRYTRLADFELT